MIFKNTYLGHHEGKFDLRFSIGGWFKKEWKKIKTGAGSKTHSGETSCSWNEIVITVKLHRSTYFSLDSLSTWPALSFLHPKDRVTDGDTITPDSTERKARCKVPCEMFLERNTGKLYDIHCGVNKAAGKRVTKGGKTWRRNTDASNSRENQGNSGCTETEASHQGSQQDLQEQIMKRQRDKTERLHSCNGTQHSLHLLLTAIKALW